MRADRLLLGLSMLFAGAVNGAEQSTDPRTEIATVLDAYHAAAADGDWARYFDLMSDDGVFLGTDAGERWPKAEFQAYAQSRSGWVYQPLERHLNLTPDGNSAWFDELLDSASYGTARGTGVLVKTAAGWKISQYNLTLPIPNALIRDITDTIKNFESAGTQ
jgi:ketosteroid isomerase-like protein